MSAGAQTQNLALDYNTIEQGITLTGNYNARLLNKATITNKDIQAKLHLLNQIDNLNTDAFYGRNRLMLGKKDASLMGEVDVTSISNIPTDVKVGIRDYTIPKLLGLYGHIEATTNKNSVNITAIVGKAFPKQFSLDFLSDNELPFKKPSNHYVELQANKGFGKHLYSFARLSSNNLLQPNYMIGIGVKK